ncbi:MAG: PEP-CTERM system TPR-repeat protein PrsT [Herminiimonas sp.]|nr:PEP-CTERM system TPR-repeat protein PrsT [Herminiimonas sp.]
MNHAGTRKISRKALATSALLAALLAVGCTKTQTPEILISEAKAYQQKGDDKAAVIQLKNALQKSPDNAEARYLLGTIYLRGGDPLSAEKELRRALSLGTPPAQVLPDLARASLMLGQPQKVLDDTAKNADSDAGLLAARGNAFLALGKFAEARQAFTTSLERKPDYADALIGLAKCSIVDKDMATATRLSEQSLAANPAHTESWLFKGDLLRAQGRVDDALAAYDQSLKLQPNNASARIVKANLEINSRKFTEARVDIDAAKKAMPDGLGVMYTQALLEFSEGKHAAALESIQKVLRSTPDNMPSVLLAGAVQYALGSMQQAEQHFKKYIDKYPEHLYARKMLASTLLKNGQTQRAIDTLEPALKKDVSDAQLWLLAGEAQMKAKNYIKATQYIEKANAISPDTSAVHTALGMSKLAQGSDREGIAQLEKAASLGSKTPETGMLLIMTHMRMKDYDKALAAAKVMEKDDPKNPLAYNLEGGIHLNKGDYTSARASFEKALVIEPGYFTAISNLAQLDLMEKKPQDAKKRLEAVVQADKKNVQAMVVLANIALADGKKDDAAKWLERAVADNPDSVPAARALAALQLQNGAKAKALTLASKLQSAHPSDVDALDLLASVQLQAGDAAASLASYEKLALLTPDSAPVQFRIAAAQMAMKNEAGATSALAKALRLDPASLDAQLALANIEARKGNFDAALAIARNMQSQQATSPGGYVLEGDILFARKNPELAVKAYERAFAVRNSGLIVKKLHASLTAAGKKKEADAKLTKWVTEHADDIDARMYMAQVALNNGQNKAAVTQLEGLVKTDPKNVAALNNLAWAYQQEKDSRALEVAEKAYALAPENAAVLDTVGWILVEKGDAKRALPILEKAISLVPQALDTRYHLVQALVKSGDKVRARKELESLVSAGKPFAGLDDAKALLKQL